MAREARQLTPAEQRIVADVAEYKRRPLTEQAINLNLSRFRWRGRAPRAYDEYSSLLIRRE